MSDTRANIEITASSSRLAAGLRRAMGMVGAFSRGVGASMKKVGESSVGSFVGNVGAGLVGRGMDFVTDQAKKVHEFETALTRFGISSGMGRAELAELGRTMREAANATGINANEIARAAGVYFDLTSDAEGTAKAMASFSRVAAASGSNMEDIVKVAAAMNDSLGITADQMEAVFGSLIAQGKAGKIGLKDMASVFTELLPKFSRFKGALGAQGMVQLGAAFQVAAKGFGSAEQAATGLEAMMGALAQNAAKFEAHGVKIFDVDKKTGVKTFRNLHDIVVAIGNSKLGKDPTLLNKAFGSKEAEAAFFQLNKLRAMYDEVARAGSEGARTVGEDFQTWIESPAGKIERSMERLRNKIAESFTPERIEAFADALERGVRLAHELADGVRDFFGIGNDSFARFREPGAAKKLITEAITEQHLAQTKGLTPDERARFAADLEQRAGSIRGIPGMEVDAEGALRAADALRRQNDAWFARGEPFDPFKFQSAVTRLGTRPDAAAAAVAPGALELVKLGSELLAELRNISTATKDAARAAKQTAAKDTEVKIDNNTVAKAASKSTDPRRR